MLEVFEAHDIRYFFYIGGNDSAETTFILNQMAVERSYDVRLFHVPKTIDNDLCVTDHCPGYGSAARFVASALMGDNEDNRSLGGIKIDVIMGRHAGWIAAAGGMASIDSDIPIIILFPEIAFHRARFIKAVRQKVKQYGYCSIVVSEGVRAANGKFLSDQESRDAFGHAQLGGAAPVIATLIKKGRT